MPRVFAYGALMAQPHVLERGRAAAAIGYRTRFSAGGLRWLEPRFLALEDAEGEHAHGVVFDIDDDEWERMARHEYTYAPTEIRVLVDGQPMPAVALVLRPQDRRPELAPSARYAGLLRKGAAHHGLPAEVVARYAELERTGSRVTSHLAAVVPVIRALMPWLGLRGAIASVLTLIVGLPLALLAMWWWR